MTNMWLKFKLTSFIGHSFHLYSTLFQRMKKKMFVLTIFHHFQPKQKSFLFWLFIYLTMAFWGPGNANFSKLVSKCKF